MKRGKRAELPGSVLFAVPRFHTNLAVAVSALRDAGCTVHIFATSQNPFEDHRKVVPRIFSGTSTRREVKDAIREATPDLVFIRSCKPVSRFVGEYCRLHRIKAFSYGQSPLGKRASFGRRIARFLDGQPLRRVTPVRGLDPSPSPDPSARYLPWPVSAASVTRVPRRPDGPLRILCIGKLAQPRKNQMLLIDALDSLDNPERIELTLVGALFDGQTEGTSAHYRALVARSQCSTKDMQVRICPNIPYAEMPDLFARHDICVLPSDSEPLGTAPLEAMAYGLVPILSSQCGSAGSVTNGQDGFVVDVHDKIALKSVLTRLCDNPELIERIGNAARETAETELGPGRFLERIVELHAL